MYGIYAKGELATEMVNTLLRYHLGLEKPSQRVWRNSFLILFPCPLKKPDFQKKPGVKLHVARLGSRIEGLRMSELNLTITKLGKMASRD